MADPTHTPTDSVWIHAIATAVPGPAVPQSTARDLVLSRTGRSRIADRLVGAAFAASGVDTRHLAVTGVDEGMTPASPYLDPDPSGTPTTADRNALAAAISRSLAADAGRDALAAARIAPAHVTHVLTVSCTAMSAPGIDQTTVRDLGLHGSARRLHLGFMGCYAAFPALSTARSICVADPDAVVLVVCVEVCSLHFHMSEDPDAIVAASVFGDGAAAMVVSARQPTTTALTIDTMTTVLTTTGEQDLTWTIGDHGFDMVLSSYVPKIIEAEIAGALEPLRAADVGQGTDAWGDVPRWAIHPGGPAILDRVERALGLTEQQLAPSRDVLSRFGNMSSATVPFILREILDEIGLRNGERVGALAFGPGLTVESALFTVRIAR